MVLMRCGFVLKAVKQLLFMTCKSLACPQAVMQGLGSNSKKANPCFLMHANSTAVVSIASAYHSHLFAVASLTRHEVIYSYA